MYTFLKTTLYVAALVIIGSIGTNLTSAQLSCVVESTTLEKADGSALSVGDTATLTILTSAGADCSQSELFIRVREYDNETWDTNSELVLFVPDQTIPSTGNYSVDLVLGDLECEGPCSYYFDLNLIAPGAINTYSGKLNNNFFSWQCDGGCDNDEWSLASTFTSGNDCIIESTSFSPNEITAGEETTVTLNTENPANCGNKQFNLNIMGYPHSSWYQNAAVNIDEQHFDPQGQYSTTFIAGDNNCAEEYSGECVYFVIVDDGEGVQTFSGEPAVDASQIGTYVFVNCNGDCGDSGWYQNEITLGTDSGDCIIDSVSFSPNSQNNTAVTTDDTPVSVGDDITLTLNAVNPANCASKEFVLELRTLEYGWDSEAFQITENNFSPSGEFATHLFVGDIDCATTEDCIVYVKIEEQSDNMEDYSGQNDYPNNYWAYLKVQCDSDGCNNDPWIPGDIVPGMGSQGITPPQDGDCVINSVNFDPGGELFNAGVAGYAGWPGFQGTGPDAWQDFYPFILRDNPISEPGPVVLGAPDTNKDIKIIINATNCNYEENNVGLKIEWYDIGTNILNADEQAETAEFYGLMENNNLVVTYLPGDEDCDQQIPTAVTGKPIKYCNYGVQIKSYTIPNHINPNVFLGNGAGQVGTVVYDPTTDGNFSTRARWYCLSNDCSSSSWSLPWKMISNNGVVPPQTGWGAGVVVPSFDTNSPCYEENLNGTGQPGYDDNCYEFLAPIPGVGGTVPEHPGRVFIDTRDYGLGNYVNQLFQVALGILIVIAVLMIILAGVQYMTTEAVTSKGSARKKITNAIIGLILALSIFIILRTINPRLLNVNFGSDISIVALEAGGGLGINLNSTPVRPEGGDPRNLDPDWARENAPVLSFTKADGSPVDVRACDVANFETYTAFGRQVTTRKELKPTVLEISNSWEAMGSNRYDISSIGGYSCRTIGPDANKISTHAYGITLDINPEQNPYITSEPDGGWGDPSTYTDMPSEFVELFTGKGFGWGGNWNSMKDAMHFSKGSGGEQGDANFPDY